MSQKWFHKATVQVAIVTGVFALVAIILSPLANRIMTSLQGAAANNSPRPVNSDAPQSSAASSSSPEQNKMAARSKDITINAPVQGPIIINQGQTGGQVAGTINNYGPPKRAISTDIRGKMLEVLQSATPECVAFASTQGDVEAHEFKELLMSVFQDANWDVRDRKTFMLFGSKKGLVVTIPFGSPETGVPQVVMQALAYTGNPLIGNRGDMANNCGVYVHVWNAP